MRDPLASDPIAERVRVSADRDALVRASDGCTWTYADLDDAVDATAGRLAALGVDTGDHVGLLADTGVPAVRVVFAALRLGAVAVPLNARLTAAELAPQLDRADVTTLVAEREFDALAREAVAAASIDVALATTDDDTAASDDPVSETRSDLDALDPVPFDPTDPSPEDLWLLLFTSGTTGRPKAVELTAGNLRSSAMASALRLGTQPDDRWFVPLSIYHMGGFAPILRSILYGTTAILQREFDAERTLAAIGEREATCLSVVPTMLQRLLDAGPDADDLASDLGFDGSLSGSRTDSSSDAIASNPLPGLRFVLSGGAATPQSLVERCAERDVALYPTYGVTETASQVATARPEEAREHEGTVGRPLLPTEVEIVDDADEPVARGDAGEIVVDGPTVSPGYYGDPDATATSRSERGYHTGDLGYRDDAGRLWVLGRADDRIVTGGENVHAAAVADVLREHDAVDDVVVLGLDDPEWGERVAALIAADLASPAVVREHCADRLAGYERPRTVAVVDDLPRTPSGTVDREAAREQLRRDGVDV